METERTVEKETTKTNSTDEFSKQGLYSRNHTEKEKEKEKRRLHATVATERDEEKETGKRKKERKKEKKRKKRVGEKGVAEARGEKEHGVESHLQFSAPAPSLPLHWWSGA